MLNDRIENVVIFWDGNYSSCILLLTAACLDLATSLERESYAQSVKCSDVLRSENCTPFKAFKIRFRTLLGVAMCVT